MHGQAEGGLEPLTDGRALVARDAAVGAGHCAVVVDLACGRDSDPRDGGVRLPQQRMDGPLHRPHQRRPVAIEADADLAAGVQMILRVHEGQLDGGAAHISGQQHGAPPPRHA